MKNAQDKITDEFVLHRLRYENIDLTFEGERLNVFDVAKARQIKQVGHLSTCGWILLSNYDIENREEPECDKRFTCFSRDFDYSSKTLAKDCPLTYAFLKGEPLRVTGNRIPYIPEPGTDTKEQSFRSIEYLFCNMYLTQSIDSSSVKAYVDENSLDITFEKDSKEPLYITFDVVYQLEKRPKIPKEKINFPQYSSVTASYLGAIYALFEEPEKWVAGEHFNSLTPKENLEDPRLIFMGQFTKQFAYQYACRVLAKFKRYSDKVQDLLSLVDARWEFGRVMKVHDGHAKLRLEFSMAHVDAKDFDVFIRRTIQELEQGIATLQKGEFPKFEEGSAFSLDYSRFTIDRTRSRWTEEECRDWEDKVKPLILQEKQKLMASMNVALRNFKTFMEICDTDLAAVTKKYFPKAKKVKVHDAILQMLADDIECDPLIYIDGDPNLPANGYYDGIRESIKEFARSLVS